MQDKTFQALQVSEAKQPAQFVTLTEADLPDGDLLVKVSHSTLNYKDALAVLGKPGVVKEYPLTCGIDLAGEVVRSNSTRFSAGDQIVLTGSRMSESRHGGYSEYQSIPADHVVHTPQSLGNRGAMAIGTAGFTAMLSVLRLEAAGLTPDRGPVLVTGATGGVGSFAVLALARLGYQVHASTGKDTAEDYLRTLGASEIVSREDLSGEPRPLAKTQWAACVDSVGGKVLANVLSKLEYSGLAAVCGLAGGPGLETTVMPFILRNVSLLGVESVDAPLAVRKQAWSRLQSVVTEQDLAEIATDAPLQQVPELAEKLLKGEVTGRMVVTVAGG